MTFHTITDEQHAFFIAARVAFRFRGEPEAAGHMRTAERAWAKMVQAEAEDQKQGEAA